MQKRVVIYEDNTLEYSDDVIYPDKNYPELNIDFNNCIGNNRSFGAIREVLHLMRLDNDNYDKREWNPLGDGLIKSGDTVLIKPNLVLEKNQGGFGEECLYTNASLISPMINYIWIALRKKGKILVADAPVQNCNFEELIEKSGYKKIIDYYKNKGVNIEIKDLRGLISYSDNGVLIKKENKNEGIVVNLGKYSEHSKIDEISKVRITNYDPNELLKHHNKNKHEYMISKEVLNADVIINMPKPKAHRKAGVTLAMKNFIGANTRKEFLPHHRFGSKKCGGDEYLNNTIMLKVYSMLIDKKNICNSKKLYKLEKMIYFIAKCIHFIDKKAFSREKYKEGSWYGNDTIWRTIIDINKIILYSDKKGRMQNQKQRRVFTIADMIVVGEKEGPLLPSPRYCGIIAASNDVVGFDIIIAGLMGFDVEKLPLYQNVYGLKKYKLIDDDNIDIISNNEAYNTRITSYDKSLKIEPSDGYKGYIELKK